jgi:hypothetical protein
MGTDSCCVALTNSKVDWTHGDVGVTYSSDVLIEQLDAGHWDADAFMTAT